MGIIVSIAFIRVIKKGYMSISRAKERVVNLTQIGSPLLVFPPLCPGPFDEKDLIVHRS